MSQSGHFSCCYQSATQEDSSQFSCSRLLQLARLTDAHWGSVGSDACQVCGGVAEPDDHFFNDVLASLLFQLSRRILTQEGIPECSMERAVRLRDQAITGLRYCRPPSAVMKRVSGRRSENSLPLHSFDVKCDIVLNLSAVSIHPAGESEFQSVFSSLLQQQDCRVFLHVLTCPETITETMQQMLNRYSSRLEASMTAVVQQTVARPVTDLDAVSHVTPYCRTEFIALQTFNSLSDPSRCAIAVTELELHGGDIFGSAVQFPGELLKAKAPRHGTGGAIPPETFVFRRTSFIDTGVLEATHSESDFDFIKRCLHQNRRFVLADFPLVSRHTTSIEDEQVTSLEAARLTPFTQHEGRVRTFPHRRVACDVVLPFRDHLNYVEEAVESILSQENCDVVLHLIDDASRESTEMFFRRWRGDSRIRCYRNITNLGQYTSFNNVVNSMETEFVAIQDGDDISFKYRLSRGVNSLLLANADIFTGSMEMFGETQERSSTLANGLPQMRRLVPGTIRYPVLPQRSKKNFVLNGTVVMRVAKFRELGGFTDYGNPQVNRGGLDTEFYLRAYLSGRARFFVSRHLALRCRRHAASATQNDTTGFGSPIRSQNREELLRRREIYLNSDFDPQAFGALGRYSHLTRLLE